VREGGREGGKEGGREQGMACKYSFWGKGEVEGRAGRRAGRRDTQTYFLMGWKSLNSGGSSSSAH